MGGGLKSGGGGGASIVAILLALSIGIATSDEGQADDVPSSYQDGATNGTSGAEWADPMALQGLMGIWHGNARLCEQIVSARLKLQMGDDGMISAEWSVASPPQGEDGTDIPLIEENYSANWTLISTMMGAQYSVHSIAMVLTEVNRWTTGCRGHDVTEKWQEIVQNCSSSLSLDLCTTTSTLNVSNGTDRSIMHFCMGTWAADTSSDSPEQCYNLKQHTGPLPGTYKFATCSACTPAKCPSGSITISHVDPVFCTASVGWEGHILIQPSKLICPESKDFLKIEKKGGGEELIVHTSYTSRLWKSGGCYGTLDCISGECAKVPTVAPSCTDLSPQVFVVDPVRLPAMGQTVLTVMGNCFQSSSVPGKVSVNFGPYTCQSPSGSSGSLVTCEIEGGIGADMPVTVTVGGVSSYPSECYGEGCTVTYMPPQVSSFSPSTCPSFGGCVLSISGSGFGLPSQEGIVLQVLVAGQECLMSSQKCPQCGHKSDTEIICMAPPSSRVRPGPVLVRRYNLGMVDECTGCRDGYTALKTEPSGLGCLCAGEGVGSLFVYVSASPVVSLTLAGDVSGFDVERFRVKLAGVLQISVEQVYVLSVLAGSVIVQFSLLAPVGNTTAHIQALFDLRVLASNGALAAALPGALNISIADDADGSYQVLTAIPPATPAPDAGIPLKYWQIVILVMVLGAVLACVGAVWRFSSRGISPWGNSVYESKYQIAKVLDDERDDEHDEQHPSDRSYEKQHAHAHAAGANALSASRDSHNPKAARQQLEI